MSDDPTEIDFSGAISAELILPFLVALRNGCISQASEQSIPKEKIQEALDALDASIDSVKEDDALGFVFQFFLAGAWMGRSGAVSGLAKAGGEKKALLGTVIRDYCCYRAEDIWKEDSDEQITLGFLVELLEIEVSRLLASLYAKAIFEIEWKELVPTISQREENPFKRATIRNWITQNVRVPQFAQRDGPPSNESRKMQGQRIELAKKEALQFRLVDNRLITNYLPKYS